MVHKLQENKGIRICGAASLRLVCKSWQSLSIQQKSSAKKHTSWRSQANYKWPAWKYTRGAMAISTCSLCTPTHSSQSSRSALREQRILQQMTCQSTSATLHWTIFDWQACAGQPEESARHHLLDHVHAAKGRQPVPITAVHPNLKVRHSELCKRVQNYLAVLGRCAIRGRQSCVNVWDEAFGGFVEEVSAIWLCM